jgi:sortase (surface protein transpeptidase)
LGHWYPDRTRQDELRDQIESEWPDPQARPVDTPAVDQDEIALGDAYAILRVPRLGDDWEKIVVQGVELSDLARGPGHYPDAEPTERRITLTTCHPRYGASQRMFVSGVLSSGEEM